MAKKKTIEFNDEYFLNLTMDFDKRDDEIYPKWAVWCANSNDRYFIDGKNGHFYTHIRTDEEIEIERKRRNLDEFVFMQDRTNISNEDWAKYEEDIREKRMKSEQEGYILDFYPPNYEQWKNLKQESAE